MGALGGAGGERAVAWLGGRTLVQQALVLDAHQHACPCPPPPHPTHPRADPLRFQAALECLSFADYSLAIKTGVHCTLCGGTIAKLGTERHHRRARVQGG